MANGLYPPTAFDFSGIQGDYSCVDQVFEKEGIIGMKGKQDPLFSMVELSQDYPLCSKYDAYLDNCKANKDLLNFCKDQQQQQPYHPTSNCLTLDEFFGSCFPAPAQPAQEAVKKCSLALLNDYGSGIKKFNVESNETDAGSRKRLSTEEIMRVAGERFIQFSDQRYGDFSMLKHPFGYALAGLSEEEMRDVELVHLLLAAAEKVGYQQFDRASRLLTRCEWIASERSNSVQRVIYCFAEALRERIDKATGRFTPKESKDENREVLLANVNLAALSLYQKVPLCPITHLTAIQAIMENIGSARKLHVIDLEIRSGVQWIAMMQALAERGKGPTIECLKVTSVSLAGRHNKVDDTGKSLENFAKSMNFPFTFKAIYVSSMNDIKPELFEIASNEFLAVVSNMFLGTLISTPDCLEILMKVIKNLNPSIIIVSEIEGNHNSPIFVNRFIEALFFYSAYFDCIETCMDQNSEHKSTIEAIFSNGIREIVAFENSERTVRNVTIDVWRAFFSRFRMVEIGFSEASLYHASLIPKLYDCGSLCSLDKNEKGLIVGWKGTPLHSVSAWKFCRDRLGRFLANYRS